MKWIVIFDVLRHIPEIFFFLVAGPLVAIFAYKKNREGQNPRIKVLTLQKKLLEVAEFHPNLFKEHVVPMVGKLDSKTKVDRVYLPNEDSADIK